MRRIKELNNEDLVIYTCMCYDEYSHGKNLRSWEEQKKKLLAFKAARDELFRRLGK